MANLTRYARIGLVTLLTAGSNPVVVRGSFIENLLKSEIKILNIGTLNTGLLIRTTILLGAKALVSDQAFGSIAVPLRFMLSFHALIVTCACLRSFYASIIDGRSISISIKPFMESLLMIGTIGLISNKIFGSAATAIRAYFLFDAFTNICINLNPHNKNLYSPRQPNRR